MPSGTKDSTEHCREGDSYDEHGYREPESSPPHAAEQGMLGSDCVLVNSDGLLVLSRFRSSKLLIPPVVRVLDDFRALAVSYF